MSYSHAVAHIIREEKWLLSGGGVVNVFDLRLNL